MIHVALLTKPAPPTKPRDIAFKQAHLVSFLVDCDNYVGTCLVPIEARVLAPQKPVVLVVGVFCVGLEGVGGGAGHFEEFVGEEEFFHIKGTEMLPVFLDELALFQPLDTQFMYHFGLFEERVIHVLGIRC